MAYYSIYMLEEVDYLVRDMHQAICGGGHYATRATTHKICVLWGCRNPTYNISFWDYLCSVSH